jgi:hypothetical protein
MSYSNRPRSFSLPTFLLTALVLATLGRVWLGTSDILPKASAQIPDAGRQLRDLIVEQRRTNRLLERLITTLEKGTIKVSIEGADKKPDPAKRRRR